MRLVNWREAGADDFQQIWHALNQRWTERLSWDNHDNWTSIERQRRSGDLPGLVLADGARIAAWCFFGVHRQTLQIGAFESESLASTRVLLDALVSLAEPEIAPAGIMMFTFTDAPGLTEELRSRGFDTDRYLYLAHDLASMPLAVPDTRWEPRFTAQVPLLLERCYGAPSLTRPFVRQGQSEEWREYAGQLLGSDACGRFAPRLSAARASSDGELEAAAVTTIVGPLCAHVAQVAVVPERRGSGLASAMLGDVLARASADGFARVSLLVGEHNAGARHLYESRGFRGSESFLSAGRPG
jgi:ribosomal protein S18 acetylase RimI-like enzyme